MKIKQNDLEYLKDMIEQGKMTVDEANIEKVRMQRVELVINRLPANVRKVYNMAVKAGKLGHMKKDGHKPEAYYHPSFEYLAVGERNSHEKSIINAKMTFAGWTNEKN